jgi:glycosyltransferase involved in cell wall biosynthesis
VYVALNEFSRQKFIEGGLPANRIVVKPNFIYPDPGAGDSSGGYAVYVGRLSAEKGVDTLLKAWKEVGGTVPLKIVGDGPLAEMVRGAAAEGPAIEWLGKQPLDAVYRLLGEALFLVLPSQCYENFPRVVVEAYAKGTPVLASRLGAMARVVEFGRTGLLFEPANPADLAEGVRRLLADREGLNRLRREARREYEEKYTAEHNYRELMAIYERAVITREERS